MKLFIIYSWTTHHYNPFLLFHNYSLYYQVHRYRNSSSPWIHSFGKDHLEDYMNLTTFLKKIQHILYIILLSINFNTKCFMSTTKVATSWNVCTEKLSNYINAFIFQLGSCTAIVTHYFFIIIGSLHDVGEE